MHFHITQRKGIWHVIVKENKSPLSAELEAIPCGNHEAAFQRMMKLKEALK